MYLVLVWEAELVGVYMKQEVITMLGAVKLIVTACVTRN